MKESPGHDVSNTVDQIQQQLANYACGLGYDGLPPKVIHAAKVRIIDTLGALVGGFFGEPCCIARNLAAQMRDSGGATVIGTRMKTTPDMAAFVNSTTSRYAELIDSYHFPGSTSGHPSEAIAPILAAAEFANVTGREFITGVVLGYEVYLRVSDVFHNVDSFDHTMFCCVSTAVAGGKLLGLSSSQLAHCIAMAVVPNATLRLVRFGHASMFKAVASGQAGGAGMFAALLSRAGMQGPHLPFEGKEGWCEHIARERFSLDTFGGRSVPFKITDTQIKIRASAGTVIAAVLAAEKVTLSRNFNDIKQVTVEIYKKAKRNNATGEHNWNPDSRETADHSVPYCVAAALKDGTVTVSSFGKSRIWDPELRSLMQKIEVVENEEFTKAYERLPQQHRSRVTVLYASGERQVGESGGDTDDLAMPKSDAQIEQKFRGLTEDILGAKRVSAILERLWNLEDLKSAVEIPRLFAFN